MDKAFQPLVTALDRLGAAIMAISPGHPLTMLATHGGVQPALTLEEIAFHANKLATDIKDFGIDEVPTDGVLIVDNYAARCTMLFGTVSHMWGSNGPAMIASYALSIQTMRDGLMPVLVMAPVIDQRAAARLARKLERVSTEIDGIVVNREALVTRMQQINEAHEAAESLPEDLQSLKDARGAVAKISLESQDDARALKQSLSDALVHLRVINESSEEAAKLVGQCEEAYRVTTSKGLAGAFDQRATGLTRSMQLWVAALGISLIIAAVLGGQRVALLSTNLAVNNPQWGVIALNFALSFLSVGAPLWFAWVSTKQISQRFRLAEDYAYKASVAKAYEGYRREAAKIDPEFSSRLFGSSLARLEEAPLRLLDTTSHGSPLHELMSSSKIQDAFSTIPELRERLMSLITEAQSTVVKKPAKPIGTASE